MALVGVLLGIWAYRVAALSWVPIAGIIVNGLALIPALTLMAMVFSGSSPTRQFNGPSGPAIDWWSLWVDLWPAYLLLLLACGITSLTCLIASVVSAFRAKSKAAAVAVILHAILTAAQVGTTFYVIAMNYPDA